MKVGENIFIKTTGNAARYGGSKIIDATVSKVGRKYFEVRELPRVRFFLDTLREDTNYSTRYLVYHSKEAIREEAEIKQLREKMHKVFSGWNTNGLKIEHYRKIDEIVREANAL